MPVLSVLRTSIFCGKTQAACRAYGYACSAANTFRGAGNFVNRKVERTCFPAGIAGGAVFSVPADLHKTETVEPAVNGSQRAEILAEWTVYFDREQYDQKQNQKFPEKQSLYLTSQQSVGSQQWQCAQKRAGGAQIFTESRYLGESAEQERRPDTYK